MEREGNEGERERERERKRERERERTDLREREEEGQRLFEEGPVERDSHTENGVPMSPPMIRYRPRPPPGIVFSFYPSL